MSNQVATDFAPRKNLYVFWQGLKALSGLDPLAVRWIYLLLVDVGRFEKLDGINAEIWDLGSHPDTLKIHGR